MRIPLNTPTAKNSEHGHTTHGMWRTKTYRSWEAMLYRCRNPNAPRYADWGGRGIRVCQRWLKFKSFLEDMGEKPEGKTLDRIDNDKNYEPLNCKWSTVKEQNANKRKYKKRRR